MTAQDHITNRTAETPELEQIPQIYAILEIVEQMTPDGTGHSAIPDEPVLRDAYVRAPGIARKSFDAIAADTARAAAGGAQKLLGADETRSAAAGRLAHHLRGRLFHLGSIVGL